MTHYASEGVGFAPPSGLDLACLAGLLDGEAHFCTGSRFKAAGRNRGLPAIRVGMTDRAAVDWLHDKFGGHVGNRGRSPTGRMVYEWTLRRQEDLRFLLPLLLPYLKVKGSQAWALLRVVETLGAQPQYTISTARLAMGSREAKGEERARRRAARLRWRCEVAQAQGSVLEARRALSDCNPTANQRSPTWQPQSTP